MHASLALTGTHGYAQYKGTDLCILPIALRHFYAIIWYVLCTNTVTSTHWLRPIQTGMHNTYVHTFVLCLFLTSMVHTMQYGPVKNNVKS